MVCNGSEAGAPPSDDEGFLDSIDTVPSGLW